MKPTYFSVTLPKIPKGPLCKKHIAELRNEMDKQLELIQDNKSRAYLAISKIETAFEEVKPGVTLTMLDTMLDTAKNDLEKYSELYRQAYEENTQLADLEEVLSLRKEALDGTKAELAALSEEKGKVQKAGAPALYVDFEKMETFPNQAAGFELLEDALRLAKAVHRSLLASLKNRFDKATERRFREHEAKLNWLKEKQKNHDEDFAREQATKLTELTEKMDALRGQIEKYNKLADEKDCKKAEESQSKRDCKGNGMVGNVGCVGVLIEGE